MSLLFSTGVIAASGLGGAAPGMVLLTPTSITHAGTSASVGANGQVTFTAVTSLSLNGVFDSTYDNYLVVIQHNASGTDFQSVRMRVSGTDNTTASSYVSQRLDASGTTVAAARETQSYARGPGLSSAERSGYQLYFYGPNLTQPTAARLVSVWGLNSGYIRDVAFTHNQSTAYDGFTLYTNSGSVTATGALQVYGVRS